MWSDFPSLLGPVPVGSGLSALCAKELTLLPFLRYSVEEEANYHDSQYGFGRC